MRVVDPNKGKEKIHTIASYDETWHKFTALKNKHNLTANDLLNLLVDTFNKDYKNDKHGIAIAESALTDIKNDINKRIKKL